MLNAQINTEAMRKEKLDPGLHLSLGGTVGYVDGNTSVFQNRSNVRLDYARDWGYTFLVANYKMSSKDDQLFINKGFLHLRGVKPLSALLAGEVFAQQEFNEFIKLESRLLGGGGVRLNWTTDRGSTGPVADFSIISGFGLMLEREKINAGQDGLEGDPVYAGLASLLRSTNYLVLRWLPREKFGMQTTAYYQVDTRRFSDYRFLNRTVVSIGVTNRLSLTLELNLRYDSEPPIGIEALDLDFSNGISYKFN